VVIQKAKVNQTNGDGQLTLLTTQAIIENGNVNLTDYLNAVPVDQFSHGIWKYQYNNIKKQIEYIYPIGNSLLAIPFVFIARQLGMDMLIQEHDASLQILLAGIFCVIIFLLNYRLAKLFLDEWIALFLAMLFSFGTSYLSTCGIALWSFDSQIVFILLLLIEIAKTETDPHYKTKGWLCGIYLFMAWVCRPSAIIFIGFFLVWLIFKQRKNALTCLITILLCFGLFVLLSYKFYGSFVPFYYDPFFWQNLSKTVSIQEGFLLVQFSPNRGLFIFSPFLLLSIVGIFTNARKSLLFWLLWGWYLAFMLTLGNLSNWWGGWSFGPRLCTDILPCLYFLFILTLKNLNASSVYLIVFNYSLIVLGSVSIYINTLQGLYNEQVYFWNDNPPIDTYYKFYKWNWQYPQFNASSLNNAAKNKDFELLKKYETSIKKTPVNASILIETPDAVLRNILSRWNREAFYEQRHFYNSIFEMQKIKNDTFYFFNDNYEWVKNNKDLKIISNPIDSPQVFKGSIIGKY